MKRCFFTFTLILLVLQSCSNSVIQHSARKLGGPTREARAAKIASEPTGNHFIGRRYFVEKTRFWGYVRKPRQPWSQAKLVVLNESQKYAPDRLPEQGSGSRRYSYDQNYEYKLYGNFTGKKAYDPNSNQILPEFKLRDYQLLNKEPGWIFGPNDYYNPKRVTLRP